MNTPSVETSSVVKLGKKLFLDNCAQCHAKDMKTKLTGPPLFDVQKRWQDDKALYDWIAKGAVAESKTTYMNALKKSYDNLLMPRFTHLKENDVEAILAYIGTQK
jgi:mono/diheme cytochrome c family protein